MSGYVATGVERRCGVMENMTFREIVEMIVKACNASFYSGTKDIKETVLNCATQIYIAQQATKKGGAE